MLIAMLAIAESRRVQQYVRFMTDPDLKSGASKSSAGSRKTDRGPMPDSFSLAEINRSSSGVLFAPHMPLAAGVGPPRWRPFVAPKALAMPKAVDLPHGHQSLWAAHAAVTPRVANPAQMRMELVRKSFDKVLCMFGFIFPLLELTASFGGRVVQAARSPALSQNYIKYLAPIETLYLKNIYLFFIGMYITLTVCSKGSFGLSKFVRFNVIQAIMMTIVIEMFGVVFPLMPFAGAGNIIGKVIVNSFVFGAIMTIMYCISHILAGLYPNIPFLTPNAKIHVQRRTD